MRRWLVLGLLTAVACDPAIERGYSTGVGTNGNVTTGGGTTGDTWDCDDLCDAVQTDNEVLCLVGAVTDDGYDMFGNPRCPSWNDTQVETEDCIACASDLGLSDDDCRRYRTTCNL